MPKRKAKAVDNSDEILVAKVPKKDLPQDLSKHGRRKALCPKSAKPRTTVKGISSNWRTLSKTLGVSSQRKRDQPESSSERKTITNRKKRRKEEEGNESAKKPDIWFDDVPLECINGEPVAKAVGKETSLITGVDKSVGKVVALDCEMVGTGHDGSYSMLARACIVNHHGYTLYDTFVAPMDKITDYRTAISGVSPKDISRAPDFHVVQEKVSNLLRDRILVGHSVQNDLKALLLSHPKKDVRDTAKYRVFKTIAKTRYPSLKTLAKEILGIDIQREEHNPVEDAQVAMKLYQLHRKEWEMSVKARLTRHEIRERKREKRRRERDTERGIQGQPSRTFDTTLNKPFNIMLHTDR